jgi:hypothetical protein
MLYRLSGLRGLTARCRTRLSGPGGRAAVWGGLLVLVWLFAFAAHALHADPLSALAVFVGTASLLRAGSALLDRFVLAAGLLGGATITAALLFSVWPWHLEPAPIAGCAMTALLAVAYATGRRPKLPRKVLWSDAVILASGAASAITLAWPVARVGFKQSLPYLTAVGQGDRLRHFSLFDAIQQVGGYGFFHSDQAREIVLPGMEANYPSGTHMLYALGDVFARSTAEPSTATAAFHRYYWWAVIGYAFFVVCVTWACRWVAGPAVSDRRRAVVCAGVGAYLATGVLMTGFWNESDAEMLGLGFFALAVALIARPPVKDGDSAVLLGALVVAVSFCYSLFLVPIALAGVAGLAVYRKRVRRSWRAYAAMALVAVPVALLPAVLPKLVGTLNVGSHLLLAGPIVRMQRRFLAGLAIVAFLGLVRAGTRRSPAYRVMFGQLLAGAAALAVFWAYQVLSVGGTLYYFEKMLHAWTVLCLVALGPAVLWLRRAAPRPSAAASPRSSPALLRTRNAVGAVAAVVAAAILAGGLHWGRVQYDGRPGPDMNWGAVWASGRIQNPYADSLKVLYNAKFLGDGVPTMALLSDQHWVNVDASNTLAVLNHDYGRLQKTLYALKDVDGIAPGEPLRPAPTGKALPYGDRSEVTERGVARLRRILAASPIPLRVVVWDPWVERELRKFAAERPDLGLRIVRVDRLGRPV